MFLLTLHLPSSGWVSWWLLEKPFICLAVNVLEEVTQKLH